MSELRLRRTAQRALDESRRWTWRFWSATETRAERTAEAVDRLERSAREQGQEGPACLLALARAAGAGQAPKAQLEAYRAVLDPLARGAAGSQSLQAGIALALVGEREELAQDYLKEIKVTSPLPSARATLGLLAADLCTASELAAAYLEGGAHPGSALRALPPSPFLELVHQMPDLPDQVALDALEQVKSGTTEEDPARWATRLLRTRPWSREEALALATYAASRVEDGWTPVTEELRALDLDRLALEREILGLQATRCEPTLEAFVGLATRLAPGAGPETVRRLSSLAVLRAPEGAARDRLALVQAALSMPLARPEDLANLAVAGLPAALDPEGRPVLAMVHAAGTCQDRLHLAQGGLKALSAGLDPDRAATLATFTPFLEQGELSMRTELAQELLEAADELAPGPEAALELGQTLLRNTVGLSDPDWHLELGLATLERVEQLDPVLPARVARVRQRLQRGTEQGWDRVDLLQRELEDLQSLTRTFTDLSAAETPEGTLQVEEGFINIMDHQIAVRDEDPVVAEPLPAPTPAAPSPPSKLPGSPFPAGEPSEGLPPLHVGSLGAERRLEQAFSLGSSFDNDYSRETQAVFTLAAAAAGFPHRAEQAFAQGAQFDDGYSTRSQAVFTQAAAVAGSPERAEEAHRLGTEFDDNYSTKTRCLFTLAAALAGDDARRAHERAVALDGNYSTTTRALFNLATAIAGERSDQAANLASEFDRNHSHKTRSVFAVAAAVAGDPAAARRAHELAEEYDNGYSTETRAMFTVAAAMAGDDARARRAFDLAEALDNGYSQKSKALLAMAAAASLNPARARYAVPIQWDFLWPKDD